MLWILSAETQKWLDQNHTSRSAKPMSAASAASMRSLGFLQVDRPPGIGNGFGRLLGRHLGGILLRPWLRLPRRAEPGQSVGTAATCCFFACCCAAWRARLAVHWHRPLCDRPSHWWEGWRRRSVRAADRARRSTRRADRSRQPQAIPVAAPSRNDEAPAPLQPLQNCSWRTPNSPSHPTAARCCRVRTTNRNATDRNTRDRLAQAGIENAAALSR